MTEHADSQTIEAINQRVREGGRFVDAMVAEVGRVMVGQRPLLERILMALLCRGHVLLEGVPGLAKTLVVKSVARAIQTDFHRIQFTPDLLPADVVGTQIYNAGTDAFAVKHGPIFTSILLADEINRAPAKVQSALLEAMEERQVTIGERTFPLPTPFMVLATQNPIEQEGTYPLPEAQMDRFMFKLKVGYPARDEEVEIMRRMTGAPPQPVRPVTDVATILAAADMVDGIYVDERLLAYVADLVHATRHPLRYGLSDLPGLVAFGASPRASIALVRAAKAHAFLRHRGYVTPEDIKGIAHDVLRHRVLLSYEAEAEEVPVEQVVDRVLDGVAAP
ncbi:MAG: MoxR family ATPase [Nitrospirae bacterium]|nr:MoxR family ATPase [Nitrospirota bacterium]